MREEGEGGATVTAAVRIIGLGTRYHGDDAAGLLAVRRLKGRVGDGVEVIEAEQAGVELLELMKGARLVILVDAACGGRPAGTIHRLDVTAAPIGPADCPPPPYSTHALRAIEGVELARTLGALPAKVLVYGIEAGQTALGSPLSSAVEQALPLVVERIRHELAVEAGA
jgi:hydrogenase maturation protease